jgi:hypothetical protein
MKLQDLFNNLSSEVIAVVDVDLSLRNEERTFLPQFSDSYLMRVGEYINEFLNDEWYEDTPSSSIDLDQSLFAYVSYPRDWDKYVDKSNKAFGITFRDRYTYIIPIKEGWEAIK